MSRKSLRKLADNPEDRRVWKQRDAVRGLTMLGKLQAHMGGTLELLTTEEQRVYARWRDAWKQMCNSLPTYSIIKFLKDTYEVSEVTAINDLKYASALFGATHHSERAAEKAAFIEDLKDTISTARTAKDTKTQLKAMELLMQVQGFDKDEPKSLDFDKLVPHTYEIGVVSEAVDKLITMIGDVTVINTGQLRESIEDAEIVSE